LGNFPRKKERNTEREGGGRERDREKGGGGKRERGKGLFLKVIIRKALLYCSVEIFFLSLFLF
jgi:hypothetical protein